MNSQPQDRYICHIAPRSHWEQVQGREAYRAESLESDGFIHCSTIRQVIDVADVWFYAHRDLVLLLIQSSKVLPPIRYEGPTAEKYPHIYGPLNREAIIAIYDFPPDEHGRFSLPQEISEQYSDG